MTGARRMIWLGLGFALVIATAAVVTACRHSPVRAVHEDGATLFPSVSGENLHGEKVTFPDDLKGQPALVLVAFKREQQAEVDTWLAQIGAFEAAIPGIRVVETPTISSTRWAGSPGSSTAGCDRASPTTRPGPEPSRSTPT